MRIKVERYDEVAAHHEDVQQFTAATQNFPHWVIWGPVDENNQQEVYYYHMDAVPKITLIGEAEEEGDETSDSTTQ